MKLIVEIRVAERFRAVFPQPVEGTDPTIAGSKTRLPGGSQRRFDIGEKDKEKDNQRQESRGYLTTGRPGAAFPDFPGFAALSLARALPKVVFSVSVKAYDSGRSKSLGRVAHPVIISIATATNTCMIIAGLNI